MKNIFIISAAVATLFACKPLDRSIRPVAGAAKEIKLGETQSFTLPNGLKVFVVENHKLPTVAYSLMLDLDPIMENEKAGYIDMAGGLLGTATTTRSKDEINASIDFIGANFNINSGGFFASSLTKNQDAMLEIISDVILNPVFTEEEFTKAKTQTVSGLASEKTDPDAITRNVRQKLNYTTAHPYGEVVSESTVENIVLADCETYFNTYFKPNVGYMAIVGDIDLETAKVKVEKYFGAWAQGTVPTHTYTTPKGPNATHVALVDKPGAVQSVVNITYPVVLDLKSEDLMAARVMNQILGGGSAARLFGNLREDKAYTYGAYSSLRQNELIGSFNANAKVRNEVTDSAIVEFLFEMNKLKNEVVTDKEVQDVINNMSGTFAIGLENASTVSRFAINIDRYNLPKDYYQTYLQRLATVTPADVNAAANKYLRPDNAHFLVVGSSDELEEKMKAFGKVDLLDIEGNKATALKPAPEGVSAVSVMANYLNAIGGAKKLDAINKVSLKYEMNAPGAPAPIIIEQVQERPNKYAMKVLMNGAVMQEMVYDGKKGTMSSMGNTMELEGPQLEDLKSKAVLFPETRYESLGYMTELLGLTKVDGNPCYKLKIVDPVGNEIFRSFDASSGLLVREESTTETQMGAMTSVTLYKDYIKNNYGITEPRIIETQAGPQNMKMVLVESMYL